MNRYRGRIILYEEPDTSGQRYCKDTIVYKADDVADLARRMLKYINCDVEEWTWGFYKKVEEELMQIVKEGE